jgi:integrase
MKISGPLKPETQVSGGDLELERQRPVRRQVVAGPRYEPTTDGPNRRRPQLTCGSLLHGSVPQETSSPHRLRRVRFHDLRHTYSSLLIAHGAHPKYIQAQLGHASIQTTLDRYGHLMPQSHQADAQKLDQLVYW